MLVILKIFFSFLFKLDSNFNAKKILNSNTINVRREKIHCVALTMGKVCKLKKKIIHFICIIVGGVGEGWSHQ